jgi:hypothetical protein
MDVLLSSSLSLTVDSVKQGAHYLCSNGYTECIRKIPMKDSWLKNAGIPKSEIRFFKNTVYVSSDCFIDHQAKMEFDLMMYDWSDRFLLCVFLYIQNDTRFHLYLTDSSDLPKFFYIFRFPEKEIVLSGPDVIVDNPLIEKVDTIPNHTFFIRYDTWKNHENYQIVMCEENTRFVKIYGSDTFHDCFYHLIHKLADLSFSDFHDMIFYRSCKIVESN